MEKALSKLIMVPVSLGELVDKITILQIKREKLPEHEKRVNVVRELHLLDDVLEQQAIRDQVFQELVRQLQQANRQLWDIEDRIRECERNGQFDENFIDLARSIYKTNDVRARLKREINVRFDSALLEEKSYAAY